MTRNSTKLATLSRVEEKNKSEKAQSCGQEVSRKNYPTDNAAVIKFELPHVCMQK